MAKDLVATSLYTVAVLDSKTVHSIIDAPSRVPGLSKDQIFFTNKTFEFLNYGLRWPQKGTNFQNCQIPIRSEGPGYIGGHTEGAFNNSQVCTNHKTSQQSIAPKVQTETTIEGAELGFSRLLLLLKSQDTAKVGGKHSKNFQNCKNN